MSRVSLEATHSPGARFRTGDLCLELAQPIMRKSGPQCFICDEFYFGAYVTLQQFRPSLGYGWGLKFGDISIDVKRSPYCSK